MRRNFKQGILPLLIAAVLTGCQVGRIAPPVTSVEDQVAPAVSVKKVLAVYEGVLPCADCQGIRTELTLFDEDFTYKLAETYLGTRDGDRTVSSGGTWATKRGLTGDPEARIYQLRSDTPGDVRDFLVVDDRQIRLLDRDGRAIESRRLDYTLTRKEALRASS